MDVPVDFHSLNTSDSGCSDLCGSNDSNNDDISDNIPCSSPLVSSTAATDCPNPDVQHVLDLMSEDGWNFSSLAGSAGVFEDKTLQNGTMHKP